MTRRISVTTQPAEGLPAYAVAILLVAVSTLVGLVIAPYWGAGAVDLVYLPAVLAAASFGGRAPALLAAVTSALAYNFFFTAPLRTFRIHSPADLVTVVMLFLVALVTSRLASSLRAQASLAAAHASRNATIAGLARHLLSCAGAQEISDATVAELSSLFACNAVMLAGAAGPRIAAARPSSVTLTPSDLAAAAVVLSTGERTGRGLAGVSTIEWQLHPVRSDRDVLAAVALARDDGRPAVARDELSLLDSLLDQVALALERARADADARDLATVRERDRVRATLLSTVSEELKPPLQALVGAAVALRRTGGGDKEQLSVVTTEVAKLQRYLDNLLQLGPDADEQPFEAGGVAIDLYHRTVTRDGAPVHLTPKEYAVLAELAKYRGRVIDHAHLLKSAWGPAYERQTDYLRVAIRALRQKLEHDPAQPKLIINEPSVGYRLVA
jgi:two-component system sensor histidine kinase KdpD